MLHSAVYGTAIYIKSIIEEFEVIYENSSNNIFVSAIRLSGINLVNIYKPLSVSWQEGVLPVFDHPICYSGDFNSHHELWDYQHNNFDGELLVNWINNEDLHVIHSSKDRKTFRSARWNTETNPDLVLVSEALSSSDFLRKSVLTIFLHSQHRSTVVEFGISIPIIHSLNKPRWNFSKANWLSFEKEMDHVIKFIPPTVENYSRFINLTNSTAKKHIPRGFRVNYIPGWSKRCDELYLKF